MGFGTPPTVLEGDYSTWSYQWKRAYDALKEGYRQLILRVDESLDKLFIVSTSHYFSSVRKLSDGEFVTWDALLDTGADDWWFEMFSVLRKYFGYVVADGGVPKLKIYKDGALIQTLDLSVAPISWSSVLIDYTVSFSPNGKYIFVSSFNADEFVLFKGS